MILIVTLNPLFERRYTFSETSIGINRNGKLRLAAGGKGINVSRQLKKWGINSHSIIFSGGVNGKLLRDCLREEEITFSSVSTNQQTRECSVVINEKDEMVNYFFSENSTIDKKEAEEFKSKLKKMIPTCELVVFSGSSPSPEADDIIPFGIETANKYDKVSVCDTYGKNLHKSLEASPTLIHNNFEEISSSLGFALNTDKNIKEFFQLLYSYGIKRTYLTRGGKNFFASNFDFLYKVTPPYVKTVDETGSGDVFVAALIYGWINSRIFNDSLKFATAAASLNAAEFSVAEVEFKPAEKLQNDVKISTLGKKIKVIDDSPD